MFNWGVGLGSIFAAPPYSFCLRWPLCRRAMQRIVALYVGPAILVLSKTANFTGRHNSTRLGSSG